VNFIEFPFGSCGPGREWDDGNITRFHLRRQTGAFAGRPAARFVGGTDG
jgi:hypothetical protein